MNNDLTSLLREADRLSQLKVPSYKQESRYAAVLGQLLTLSDDAHFFDALSAKEKMRIERYANVAYGHLGGMLLPSTASVSDYNADKFGPFFAVSDEGSAGANIRDAAIATPKAVALRSIDPMAIGMGIDAERMGASGEVPTGPDEYKNVRLTASRNILTTTNVGVRVNIRYFQPRHIVRVGKSTPAVAKAGAAKRAKEYLAPYLSTPNGVPRPQTILLQFTANTSQGTKVAVVNDLNDRLKTGDIGDPSVHKIALLLRNSPRNAIDELPKLLLFASRHGVDEVVYHSMVRPGADNRLSVAGLLNFFSVDQANELLRIARVHKVRLTTQNQVDTNTVSRNAWVALNCCRRMGVNLGKYGLFPLTFEEQKIVVSNIQRWMKHWDAVPAFYVDTPLVTERKIFSTDEVVTSAKRWLKMVSEFGVRVVLFDCPHRLVPRRLLKRGKSDEIGILNMSQLRKLDDYAKVVGVRVLWAGGIAVQQVYELAAMGVFGIYTTSTTGTAVPAGPVIGEDPRVAYQVEPTLEGVMRVKVLIEAGFLSERTPNESRRREISQLATQLIDAIVNNDKSTERNSLDALRELLPTCWRSFWRR